MLTGFIVANCKSINTNLRMKDAADLHNLVQVFKIRGETYIYVKERKSWNAARAICKRNGGDLATFPRYNAFDDVSAVLPDEHTWVGAFHHGNDIKTGWKWVTGELLSYENPKWRQPAHREPDTRPAHDYALITTSCGANKQNRCLIT